MNTYPSRFSIRQRFPLFLLLVWLLAGWPTTPLYAAAAVIFDNTSNLTAVLNAPGSSTSLATSPRGVTFTMGSTGYTLTSVTFGVYGNGSGTANVGLDLYSGNAASGTPLQTVAPASQSITTIALGGTKVAFTGLNWTLNANTQYTVAINGASVTQTPRLALSTVSPPTTEGLTFNQFTDGNTQNYYVQLVGNVQSTIPPDAPTIGTATAGNAQATVTFTPPANPGSSPITGYTATSSPGSLTSSGCTTSPCTVTGLTNSTAYTFTVTATSAAGTSPPSAASNSVTPTCLSPAVVTSTANDGAGSLRAAITDACADSTITFNAGATPTIALNNTTNNTHMFIDKNLTIDGTTQGVTIEGSAEFWGDSRIFYVNSGINFTLKNLTVTKGWTGGRGGALYNDGGTVTLLNMTFSANKATSGGGAIYSKDGTLTLTDTTLSGNILAGGNGGGLYSENSTLTLTRTTISSNRAPSYGGAIYNDGGTLTLTETTMTGNQADSAAPGIYSTHGGLISLTDSTISDSSDPQSGSEGGIYASTGDDPDSPADVTLTLTNTTVSGQKTQSGAGGIHLDGPSGVITATLINSRITGNSSTGGAGGIVFTTTDALDTLTILNSTISSNSSSNVYGGIYSEGTVILTNSTVSGNSGPATGGIRNAGTLTVNNSTISGNTVTAAPGGGIYNTGTLTLNNSTLSGNAVTVAAPGGGIFMGGGTANLNNVSIVGNSIGNGPPGGGIYNQGGTITLKNTLLADNTADSSPNCFGTITNGANNLEDGTSCGWNSDNGSLSNTNPLLGTLGDYGGTTALPGGGYVKTIPLLPGSPAMDAGDAATCADAGTVNNVDQRGVTRPQGAGCDIGAFELEPPGACGSAHGVAVSTAPTTNLCSEGTVSSVSGSGPWTWTCTGGTTASCSAPLASSGGGGGGVSPVNGLCGSANGQTFISAPTSGFCTLGSASAVIGSGPWSWSCAGSFGGSDASCNAAIQNYTVTATAGEGGAISPATQTVNHGATATVTVTPNTGYGIDTVTGCGGALNSNAYTTGAITGACTVNATFKVTQTATTTVLTSAPSPSTSGQSVTLTATVRAASGSPTGTVTFQNGGTTLSGCASVALSGNTATCATATLPVGVRTLSAAYAGDATFTASTGTATHRVNALEPVTLTTPALPNAVVGIPYAATLGASGGEPPYRYTGSGLPAGLFLSIDGVLSGTPLQAGASTVTITVTDAQGQTGQRIYPLTVENALAVVTPHLIDGIIGAAYGQVLEAVGGVLPYMWALQTGALPDGLTLDPASGLLSGVPTTPGTQTFTVQVTDDQGQTATHDLTLTVQAATFTRPDPVNPTQPPLTVALQVNPEAGATCTFDDLNTLTLQLGDPGAPAVGPAGIRLPHGLLQVVVDGCTPGDTTLTLTLVYPQNLPAGTQFWKYGKTLAHPTDHWYVLEGVVMQGNTLTYTIRDGGFGDDDLTANGRIIDPAGPGLADFALTGALPTTGQVGESYEGTLTAHNGIGPYVWSVAAGALPDGLALVETAPDEPTAFLSGTPTVARDFAFTLQVVDEGNGKRIAQQAFTLAIQSGVPATCPWGLGPDTDGDGVPDPVETAQGTNPQVKDNDVFGSPSAFVSQLYRDLLQRESDPAGQAYWEQELTTGVLTRGQIIEAFYQSLEFQSGVGAISRFYHAAFGRIPDLCGLAYWAQQGVTGQPLPAIAHGFLISDEFLGYDLTDNVVFITQLYQHVLNRVPTPDELDEWLAQIDQGASWGQVLHDFSQSTASRAALASTITVDLYYFGFLYRQPDAAGYAYWVNDLDQTADPAPVHEAMQAAPEYRYRVLGAYGVQRQP